jgi:hypothetical protein
MLKGFFASSPGDSQHLLPVFTRPSLAYASRKRILSFVLAAAALGVFFNIVLIAFPRSLWQSKLIYNISEDLESSRNTTEVEAVIRDAPPPQTAVVSSAITGQPVTAVGSGLSTLQLQALVKGTRGYYARDYSLGLGWNNVWTLTNPPFTAKISD